MSVLCDRDIEAYCLPRCGLSLYGISPNKLTDLPMIDPYCDTTEEGVISFGVTSAGYDVRLDYKEFYLFKNTYGEHINPKLFNDPAYKNRMFERIEPEVNPITHRGMFVLPPHAYILAQTHEYIRVPPWLKGHAIGKSTYARCAVIANLTPLEPEWEGHLTLEIGNLGPSPAVLFIMEGICQIEFFELTNTPRQTYAGKKGKYQCQKEVTVAKIKDNSEREVEPKDKE